MTKPTVFISYCREDEHWRHRFAEQFEHEGISVWDDTHIRWGEAWLAKIKEAITEAAAGVLLLSEDFLKSEVINGTELPGLRERLEREGLPIFPVEVRSCDWSIIPWLSELQVPRIPPGDAFQTDTILTAIVRDIVDILKKPQVPGSRPWASAGPPEKICLGGLASASAGLFGREDELARLDEAWERPRTSMVLLTAFGGVGKTALVRRWLSRMAVDDFRGAEMVLGWSFVGPRAEEGGQASADAFLAFALAWFGDPDPAKGNPWEKGTRLAELVRKRRTLLVLDGVEPLQSPGEGGGRLRDPGLERFLGDLAWYNPGLCIVTSRLPVAELKDAVQVVSMDLGNLKPEDGADYLAWLGVKGGKAELQEVSREFGGHALALTLLGKYLVAACRGDVRQRSRISLRPGSQVAPIMEAYEGWLRDKLELGVLRILGLFDRPATAGAVTALRADPPIDGLTSQLRGLSDEEWQLAVHSLRTIRLLDPEDPDQPENLDCHPLVRQYLGDRLKKDFPAAWRDAHGRLFEYYRRLPAKEFPDTFEEMAPLFAAIWHGCEAGRHQEALDDVYFHRTRRHGEFYSTQKLGAFGADLAALACFFDAPWAHPVDGLGESDKGLVLNEAGESLRALGRLNEAIAPLEAAAKVNTALGDLRTAAVNTGNLSQLFLAKGDLARALACGGECVELAERSGDVFQRMVRRCDLANALHHMGCLEQAEAAFQYAEEIQRSVAEYLEAQGPDPPVLSVWREWGGVSLHAVRGFQYCGLLLSLGRSEEVWKRATYALEIAMRTGRLLHIGLSYLSAGEACLIQAIEDGKGDYAEAAYRLEHALISLRRCGRRDYLPYGLVARAKLHRMRRVFKDAQRDLDEAMSIASRDGMDLHRADCGLEYARLYLALDDAEKARKSLNAAKEAIERTAYHRRDGELSEIGARLLM
jgi:tetratricopeptide (TPR) repeat protein